MGYDLEAYFDFDQEEISENDTLENFIQEKLSDLTYKKKLYFDDYHFTLHDKNYQVNLDLMHYKTDYGIHHIITTYPTNFIRDDKRFNDRVFHKHLEKKIGQQFPCCLQDMNYYIRTSSDAKECADAIDTFFSTDTDLVHFANWLRVTSKYCSIYELSC